MAYLTLEDYALSISKIELDDILTEVANGYSMTETNVRLNCEKRAEAMIRNFLSAKYNISSELSKTGDARNQDLVGICVDLSLCSIFKGVSPEDIPEMRAEQCKYALEMLEKWRDGEISLDGVDLISEADGGVGLPEFINPTKFISKPYSDPILRQ